jgi:thiamine pyrophosphokinase
VIIPAWAPDGIRDVVELREDDFIVCADGGFLLAQRENIVPHALVGDFDSLGKVPDDLPTTCRVLKVEREKNETDTFLCLACGLDAGCGSFAVAGGIGGRLDHTVANLQLLFYAVRRGFPIWIMDKHNRVTAMEPGEMRIPRQEGFKLSVLAYAGRCEGVTLENVKYPLLDAVLTDDFPLGISNEFMGPEAMIRLKTGSLIVFLSRDNDL